MHKKDYSRTLKVGVYLDQLMYPIDPSINPNLTNAFFSNNLYANLVDIDENNNFNNELASKYWFDATERKLYFEFNQSRVTAEDAEFSLRRLVAQNRHLHADFWNIICEENEPLSNCINRIYVENDKLVINYFDERKSQYIIPTLASVDYKIVPKAAFDSSVYETAKVVNYKITSGHYYLEKRESDYFFVKNEGAPDNIYQTYKLVNMNADTVESLINDVDIVSTTVVLQERTYNKLIEQGWNIFKTHNISIHLLVFSINAMSKTTEIERFNYSQRLVAEAYKLVKLSNSNETIEFFQDYGLGFLDEKQKSEIRLKRNQKSFVLPKSVTYGTKFPEKWSNFEKVNPDIRVVQNNVFPTNMKRDEQPDMFILSNDVSFDLSLSLISYAANIGLLSMNSKEVDFFANLETEKEKIEYINKIHFKTLKECMIYPMLSSPYHTAFNGDFKHSLSKFNSRTLLWKIH